MSVHFPDGLGNSSFVATAEDQASYEIIGASIDVHRRLGPGLLESAYETCLDRELVRRGLVVARQVRVDLRYRDVPIQKFFVLDMIVAEKVIVEVKAVAALAPIHVAQALTYLRITGMKLCLLLNFNVSSMRQGIRRVMLDL